jgi:hypothetical protein
MARARKSHDTGKEEVKSSRAKLEPAYSSRSVDRFVVYADLQREGDPYARVLSSTSWPSMRRAISLIC